MNCELCNRNERVSKRLCAECLELIGRLLTVNERINESNIVEQRARAAAAKANYNKYQ